MARLPVPGSDEGEWGSLLNDFLTQAHNSDGTIKSSAVSGAIGDATTTDKGVVQLAGDLGGTAAAPTVPGLTSKVSDTRQVIAGTGLTGGGDLTAHRTLAVDFGGGATQVAAGNHTHSGFPPTSRQIAAGTGLTGGGDLSADRTLTVDFGSSGTQVAAGNHTHATLTPTTRQIVAGSGLTGGGDLTVDRTLAVDFGTAGTQVAAGNHTHATLTPTSRQITAGTGLTGGGNFTADRTLAVDFGTGATQVAAGNHTHAASTVRQTQTWAWSGVAQVVAGTGRWYNRTGAAVTIFGVWASAGTAPTGTSIIVDVNLNGTTIFTTQANRPTVPAATNGGTLATPDVTTVPDGGYLVIDVDQVGSTTPGNDLTVGVLYS